MRLLVGGGGPRKTPRLAGLYADEFNIYACHPEEYAQRATAARTAAAGAGRDPGSIFLTMAGPAVAARKESDYRQLLEKHAVKTKSTPERIETVYSERGYPHGSGSKPAEMVAALEEAGCQRFYMQIFVRDLEILDLVYDAYQA